MVAFPTIASPFAPSAATNTIMIRRNFLHTLLGLLPAAVSANIIAAHGVTEAPVTGDPSLTPLEEWLNFPIQPVWNIDVPIILDAPDPIESILLAAIHRNETLSIRYHGGVNPGSLRSISPALLFHKLRPKSPGMENPLYLLAWCHRRNQLRTFRLDRISLPELSTISTNCFP